MSDAFEFDPAAIDRAIARLTTVLDMADQRAGEIDGLRHVTCPGEAPPTRAFHGLLATSMAKLRERHEAFRHDLSTQIEELRKTRNAYTAADRLSADEFGRIT